MYLLFPTSNILIIYRYGLNMWPILLYTCIICMRQYSIIQILYHPIKLQTPFIIKKINQHLNKIMECDNICAVFSASIYILLDSCYHWLISSPLLNRQVHSFPAEFFEQLRKFKWNDTGELYFLNIWKILWPWQLNLLVNVGRRFNLFVKHLILTTPPCYGQGQHL